MFRRRRLSRSRRKYELQGAPEFLFDSRPYELPCGDRKPGQSEVDKWRAVSFVAGNEAPICSPDWTSFVSPRPTSLS